MSRYIQQLVTKSNLDTKRETDEVPDKEEIPLPPVEKDKEENFKRFFHSVSGEDMEVNPYELHKALNEALRKEPLHSDLSIDACKKFTALLDVDNSGKLGYTEFLYLWNLIRSWKRLFYQFDIDRNGMLNSFELRRVIAGAGFKVDNYTMKNLVWRYADENSLVSLDRYLTCLAKLMKMFNDFNKLKQNDQMVLTLNQWLQMGVS